GAALGDFGKQFGGEISNLKTQVPQPISLSEKENLDPGLQELLERLSTNQKRQSEKLAELQGLLNKKISTATEIPHQYDAIEELLNVKPVNDQEKLKWINFARYIWISEVRTIVQQIYLLKRAFIFETGNELTINSDLLNFPSALIATVDAGSIDMLAPGTQTTSGEVKEYLEDQRRKIVSAARFIHQTAQNGLDDYLSRNQEKISFQRALEFRKDDED